jgi:hypothetical protein
VSGRLSSVSIGWGEGLVGLFTVVRVYPPMAVIVAMALIIAGVAIVMRHLLCGNCKRASFSLGTVF